LYYTCITIIITFVSWETEIGSAEVQPIRDNHTIRSIGGELITARLSSPFIFKKYTLMTQKLGTKMLTARVPLEFYIKMLQESNELGITITDYIILKLSGGGLSENSGGNVEKSKEIVYVKENPFEVEKLEKALDRAIEERTMFWRQVQDLKETVSELQHRIGLNGVQDLLKG
jgi:hypothetical protein